MKKEKEGKFDTTLSINNPQKQKDFNCEHCLDEFEKGQRIVIVGTYDINSIMKENGKVKFINVKYSKGKFYHLQCWRDWFNQKIHECVSNMQKQLLNNPAIKQAMAMVEGILK